MVVGLREVGRGGGGDIVLEVIGEGFFVGFCSLEC